MLKNVGHGESIDSFKPRFTLSKCVADDRYLSLPFQGVLNSSFICVSSRKQKIDKPTISGDLDLTVKKSNRRSWCHSFRESSDAN